MRDFAAYAGPRIAAVVLGIARAAIDAFTALARTKTPLLVSSNQKLLSSGQVEIVG
jgi:hypothetical protein